MTQQTLPIIVRNLEIAYGDFVIQRNLNFQVNKGEIFVIMGGSGCGKTTVMRCMSGLKPPSRGEVLIEGVSLWRVDPDRRAGVSSRFGIVYQSGALWSSMTLAENIGLPLGEYTDLSPADIRDLAALKLALVGLAGFEDYYPSEISGGMRKRAGVARALALDPNILFFDEPSAGLDPITSSHLDDLIVQLRDHIGMTMVLVTHELPSIFDIADNAVYLDAETKSMIATGSPDQLLSESADPKVRAFLTRNGKINL
ncbi:MULTISPECIES: ABC transporter ATP-binding protein [Desulfococcus]|jgi:phospholipid/cholesterol/gamma-HCH transport system ATP-binding protein|uniref:ABC transporter related protein n=1 Tax=Desulfococcus multivorans DSM 2059 TaxID=1121405 RepID=S7TKZ2_DESML|nr:ATP-binding cassette domain-containing protein [Desulfococcus multivorans]AOY59624.1 putative ABC transporter, ATP-binding protein [Desulfococcus multivorans]AQV01814.1 polyamine ABC transporter ATP-binding protein [Desulfococcus multivorans]EPR37887.1 ABC transporter related protein [Desulfococcus multivorans DSM 2059]MDX9817513.1 ATP-binding cassette domain-containing protein [Desulfococcus multivorans]SKA16145.1 phospholipid/cholesterol/gamma-HCH transport system ATP-binding protein [Des